MFLLTLPLAALALVMATRFCLRMSTNRPTRSTISVASCRCSRWSAGARHQLPARPRRASAAVLILVGAAVFGTLFYLGNAAQRFPLYDLVVAARRLFWVAALGGIIVFGLLMGAMFIGQQFLQNVLGYDTLEAGAAILPAVFMMVLAAPRSAKLVQSHGSRFTLLLGYGFCLLGFVTMLVLWDEGIQLLGGRPGVRADRHGVGFAGTPASNSLTGSVPVTTCRYGLRHRRPPARPRRCDHAVRVRCAADGRVRERRRIDDRVGTGGRPGAAH